MTAFPELRPAYEREAAWWGEESPGTYIVYEDIFYPYIAAALAAGDQQTTKRIFEFVETLATRGETETDNLLRIAILTPLPAEESSSLALALKHMGSATRRLFRDTKF